MSTAYSEIEDLFIPLTEAEQDYHVQIRDTNTAGNLAKGALAIAAAFYGYRWYMKRAVAEHMREMPPTASALQTAIQIASKGYLGFFVTTIAPSLVSGYAAGLVEVHRGKITDDVLREIAVSYAWELGEHINQVSAEAVVKGYQAQLNRKIPPARAQQRVLEAFGVSPRTMNSLVQVWTAEDPKISSSVTPIDHKSARAERIIRDGLKTRSRTIGENEIWSVRSQAKQVTWMYQIQMGKLPEGIKRRWVTATDERVCPTCGPMDGTSEAVSKPFKVKGYGKTWAPPLHPNCRCDIVLDYVESEVRQLVGKRELVMKARPGDPYDRDNRGRFAPSEQRSAKPKLKPVAVKERTKMDPELAEALSQLQAEPETKTEFSLKDATRVSDRGFSLSEATETKGFSLKDAAGGFSLSEALTESQPKVSAQEKLSTQEKVGLSAPIALRRMSLDTRISVVNRISLDVDDLLGDSPPKDGVVEVPKHVIGRDRVQLRQDEDGNTFFVAKDQEWDLLEPDGAELDPDYSEVLNAQNARLWWQSLDNHWAKFSTRMNIELKNAGDDGLRLRLTDGRMVEITDSFLWAKAVDYAIYKDPEVGAESNELPIVSDEELYRVGDEPWDEGYLTEPEFQEVTVSAKQIAESTVIGANGFSVNLNEEAEVKRPAYFVTNQADQFRAHPAATTHGTGVLPGKYKVVDWFDHPKPPSREEDSRDDRDRMLLKNIPPHTVAVVELVLDEHEPDVDD